MSLPALSLYFSSLRSLYNCLSLSISLWGSFFGSFFSSANLHTHDTQTFRRQLDNLGETRANDTFEIGAELDYNSDDCFFRIYFQRTQSQRDRLFVSFYGNFN